MENDLSFLLAANVLSIFGIVGLVILILEESQYDE